MGPLRDQLELAMIDNALTAPFSPSVYNDWFIQARVYVMAAQHCVPLAPPFPLLSLSSPPIMADPEGEITDRTLTCSRRITVNGIRSVTSLICALSEWGGGGVVPFRHRGTQK